MGINRDELVPGWPWYVKDNVIHFGMQAARRANVKAFKPLSAWWGRDDQHVYCAGSEMRNADVETFTVLNPLYAKDAAHAYTVAGEIYAKTQHGKDCVIRLQFRAAANADSGIYVHGKQLQCRDYPKAGPKEYAVSAKPAGEWNDLEFDITSGVAVVKLNGQVIEKAWKIGDKPDRGLGLQRERGDFDFRYVRMMEKK